MPIILRLFSKTKGHLLFLNYSWNILPEPNHNPKQYHMRTTHLLLYYCCPAKYDGGQHGLYVGKVSLICEDYSSYNTVKSFIYSPTHE